VTQVVVTVRSDDGKKLDLSVPWEIAVEGIIEGLVESLDLPSEREYEIQHIQKSASPKLSSYASLAQAGVMMGDILELVPIVKAYLSTDDGLEFLIANSPTVIGRSVPGTPVDIDLSAIDEPKLISRKHATINILEGSYQIEDNESLNGILVNGKEVGSASPVKLEAGDRIHFGGKHGISLVFNLDQ